MPLRRRRGSRSRPSPRTISLDSMRWGRPSSAGPVAALCARLSIEGQLELREDLLGRAREVAEAAGGFLGVRSISRREETVLRELESVFPV